MKQIAVMRLDMTRYHQGCNSSAASISAALARAGQKEWISDRPTGDTWCPVRMTNGASITGFSLGLSHGPGDWRLELRL